MPSADAMQAAMNSPMMQSMLNVCGNSVSHVCLPVCMMLLCQNPELLRSIMMSNPAIRQMIEANPEIGTYSGGSTAYVACRACSE